jgi:hypothetical protein
MYSAQLEMIVPYCKLLLKGDAMMLPPPINLKIARHTGMDSLRALPGAGIQATGM